MTIIISKTKLALGVLAMVLIGATVVAAGDGPFTDNPDGTYYHDPVEWAFDNGVTTGTSATTFSPMDPVTRGQNVTFAYRYDQNIVQPELETIDQNFDVVTDAINDNADAISDIEDNVATVASDVNNATRVYFARVASDGTVEKRSADAITVQKNGTGFYKVTLPEDAGNCAVHTSVYTETASDAGAIAWRAFMIFGSYAIATHTDAEDNPAEEVDVATGYMPGGTPTATDIGFSITAYCSDPQFNLIVPGVILTPIFIP